MQEPSPFRRPTRREGRVTSYVMGGAGEKSEKPRRPARVRLWVAHASTVLLWTCFFVAFRELWAPSVLTMWPGCLTQPHVALRPSEAGGERAVALPPKRIYKNNGYLMVSCNGGLNQMRAAICDMVTIARYLNVTLIVPELDRTSFWADPSEFQDIFDVDYFISSLRDEVRILRQLPPRLRRRVEMGFLRKMPPVSWSDMTYYHHQV